MLFQGCFLFRDVGYLVVLSVFYCRSILQTIGEVGEGGSREGGDWRGILRLLFRVLSDFLYSLLPR